MSNYSRDLTVLLNMRKYCRYISDNLNNIPLLRKFLDSQIEVLQNEIEDDNLQ